MREQFQKAFADLTASSDLVRQVRVNPALLAERYDLTEIETRRLTAIVYQRGMECNCILYRANRLAPIVINLPELSKSLDKQLRPLLSEFWTGHVQLSDNFWVEADDFCEFVRTKIAAGVVTPAALDSLEREQASVINQLAQIYPEKYKSRSLAGAAEPGA